MIKKKIVLTGCFGVGKTSLFNRYLYNQFSDVYQSTIGVKIDKKIVDIDADTSMVLLLWDIAGEVTQDKIPPSYFLGSSAIVFILDATRFYDPVMLKSEYTYLKNLCGDIPILPVINKVDIATPEQIQQLQSHLPVASTHLISAKTGGQVPALFDDVVQQLMVTI